jgi:hypothetical protein
MPLDIARAAAVAEAVFKNVLREFCAILNPQIAK